MATVRISVYDPNQAPIANPDVYTIDEDSTLVAGAGGVLANDSDPEGKPINALLVSKPNHGILAMEPDGSFTYVPEKDFYGFDNFTYQALDGTHSSSLAAVNIQVTSVNDAPKTTGDEYAVDEDTILSVVPTSGLLVNDSDVEGDTLSVNLLTGPQHGQLTFESDGSFKYLPDLQYNGHDAFIVQVSDSEGGVSLGSVSIIVNPINDLPVALPDSYSLNQDTALAIPAPGLLANDLDADGDVISVELVSGPAYGRVSLAKDGAFEYRPNVGYSGDDIFTYKLRDGLGHSAVEVVRLAIIPAPVLPNGVTTSMRSSLNVWLV